VVVQVDPALLPFLILEGVLRQRLERGLLDLLEDAAPRAFQLLERPVIVFVKQGPDGPVKVFQTEKPLVAQLGEDALLDAIDARFHAGLVLGLQWTSWKYCRTIVF
jgi:hypothetical protein